MSRYVVMVIDSDEEQWENATEAERQRTYDADLRFVELLKQRGGSVVGGEGLAHSRHTRVLAHDAGGQDGVRVSDGPYAEAVEQLGGFYVVECDSLDDLTEACRLMLPAHHHLEIRPVPDDD